MYCSLSGKPLLLPAWLRLAEPQCLQSVGLVVAGNALEQVLRGQNPSLTQTLALGGAARVGRRQGELPDRGPAEGFQARGARLHEGSWGVQPGQLCTRESRL